jgi:hypothetical protein
MRRVLRAGPCCLGPKPRTLSRLKRVDLKGVRCVPGADCIWLLAAISSFIVDLRAKFGQL